MKRNQAGQVVAFSLTATDGSPVTTGTTTVYVTGDNGTQTAGAGTVAHKGNGQWSYVPTQAETNYTHVALLTVNAGAMSQTINIYPESVGSNGLPAVDLIEINSTTAALTNLIAAFTGTITSFDALDTAQDLRHDTTQGYLDTEIAQIISTLGDVLTDTQTTLDGKLNTLQTAATAIKAVTDVIPDAGALTALSASIAGIKAKTDSLTFTRAGEVDCNMQSCNDQPFSGDGTEGNLLTV